MAKDVTWTGENGMEIGPGKTSTNIKSVSGKGSSDVEFVGEGLDNPTTVTPDTGLMKGGKAPGGSSLDSPVDDII